MLTLYYSPKTRATRVRWMLEELEVPYSLHRVDMSVGEHKRAAYLAEVHPLRRLPSLCDGDTTFFESGAILTHLADKYSERKLAPAPATSERALYYQWLFYSAGELEPHVWSFWLHTHRLPESRRVGALAEAARSSFVRNVVALERRLADGRSFLLCDFSAADVHLGWLINWAAGLDLLGECPYAAAWAARLLDRPAHQRARAD